MPKGSGQRRLGDHQDARPRSAAASCRHRLRVRFRRSDLQARQRLLQGHRRLDRLRWPANGEGLVTALTDGHPGVSGGGVLDQRGVLVGIPIGRMQGDYRFSFILPMRAEMMRKVPLYEQPEPPLAAVAEQPSLPVPAEAQGAKADRSRRSSQLSPSEGGVRHAGGCGFESVETPPLPTTTWARGSPARPASICPVTRNLCAAARNTGVPFRLRL